MNDTQALDWVAAGLAWIGGIFALVASVQGIRLRPDQFSHITETGSTVFGAERIVKAMRKASRVLLWASAAVLVGALIQTIQLASR